MRSTIRKGTALTWANSPDVRKIYVILDHSAAADSEASA